MRFALVFISFLNILKMVEPDFVNITLLNLECVGDDEELNRFIKSEIQSNNSFQLSTFCSTDFNELERLFKDDNSGIFLGAWEPTLNAMFIKYAEIYRRGYVSPTSISKPYDKGQLMTLGASFERTAVALSMVLTHFEWRKVLLITEEISYWTSFGTSLFIELTHSGFQPTVVYIQNKTYVTDIEQILDDVDSKQKGIILLTSPFLQSKIIEAMDGGNFAYQHAIFILQTNVYRTLNIELFNTTSWNTTGDILDAIFYLKPVFELPEGNVSKRSAVGSQTNSIGAFDSISQRHFVMDSVLLIDKLLSDGSKYLNSLFGYLENRTIPLYTQEIYIDHSKVILYDFELSEIDKENGEINKVQEIKQLSSGNWEILGFSMVRWPDGRMLSPDDCFYPSSCVPESTGMDALYVLAIVIAVLFVAGVATAIIIAVWRKIIHRDMSKGQHKVLLTKDDLVFLQKRDAKGSSKINGNSNLIERPDLIKDSGHRTGTNRSMVSLHEYASEITETARYNGDLVHAKQLKVKNFEMKSKLLHVIKTLREVRHENVNAFIGFYDDPQSPAIILDFCSRGSLEDVLNNHDIKLDWDFKVSLLTDLIRGVRYIHNSSLRWHGNLKCRNCLIDSRWVLKVSDFGLPSVYGSVKQTPEFKDTDLLCMAPEHLRDPVPGMKGSEKGDVYSISIIMQCVVLRSDPYSTAGLSPPEIIQKLKHPPPLLRPSVSHGTAPPQYIQLMKVCWTENPEMRPGMEEIYQQFKTFTGGKKMNIVDTMFRMLEKYSTDLEDLVKDRTLQLEEEKKKTDLLLYRMLPEVVADSLKVGRSIAAEQFSEVTIYFSDIVGFTTISAKSTPLEVVDLLNGLYTMFDATIDAYDVYKVETIGDAYMVCSGLPVRNENRHAGEISTMALDLLSQCGNFTIKHMPEVPLRVRIGLHSGPCVAGVVGLTMPRYCLFGDTVNTASRMESTGSAYRIHISEAVKTILEALGGYQTEYRGEVELKGKGMAKTYWLIGKDSFTKELPKPPPITNGENHGLSLDEFVDKSRASSSHSKEKPPLRRITSNSVLLEDNAQKSNHSASVSAASNLVTTHEIEDEHETDSTHDTHDKSQHVNVINVTPKYNSEDKMQNTGPRKQDSCLHLAGSIGDSGNIIRIDKNPRKHSEHNEKLKSKNIVVEANIENITERSFSEEDLNEIKETDKMISTTNHSLQRTDLHCDDEIHSSSSYIHDGSKHVTFENDSKQSLSSDRETSSRMQHRRDSNFSNSSSAESDTFHTCDIHGINLSTAKQDRTGNRRHTKPSPRRINVSPGFQQSRSRKISDASENSKRRRPSYQESLV